jgi:hypothetical protein
MLIVFCSTACTSESAIDQNQANDNRIKEVNIILSTDKDLTIKRVGWNSYYNAGVGTIVNSGDLIKSGQDSTSIVLCSDLTLWEVPRSKPVSVSSGCKKSKDMVLLLTDDRFIGATRLGPEDLIGIPYLISPRATRIVDSKPIIQWNPVSNIEEYTIQLIGGNITWTETSDKPYIEYSGRRSLQPDVWYSVIVTTDDGRSSKDEEIAGIGFSPINEAQVETLQDAIYRINSMDIREESKPLAIAHLYIRFNLISDAIDLLNQMIDNGYSSSAIQLTLAEQYSSIGLYIEAEEYLLSAIWAAEESNEIEVLALANKLLGMNYLAQGINSEGKKCIEDAIHNFELIGESSEIKSLEELK